MRKELPIITLHPWGQLSVGQVFTPGMMWNPSSYFKNQSLIQTHRLYSAILVVKTVSVVASEDARSWPRAAWCCLPPLSAVWGLCPQWCALTVSEGVMFQRWIAFPVFIDCSEAALDDTAFRYISGTGSLDGLSEGAEKWGGQTLRHHLAYSRTQRHRLQPHCSPGCFLCFHCAIIGREQTTTSGGKATDSSVSNVLKSPGREIYIH